MNDQPTQSNNGYLDIGYDQFLTRDTSGIDPSQASLALSAANYSTPTTGDQIQSGIISSKDGKLLIDLTNDTIIISDGTQNRVTLGTLDDGSTGMVLKDQNGNIIMQISNTTNLIQSASQNFQIDLTNEQLLVLNNGIAQILLGKLIGGF